MRQGTGFLLFFTLKFIFSPQKQLFRCLCPFVCSERHASSKGIEAARYYGGGCPQYMGFHPTVRGCPFARGKVLTVWVQPHLRGLVSRRGVVRNKQRFNSRCRCFPFLSSVHLCNALITATVSVRWLLERRQEETKSRVKKGITQPQEP